MNMMRSTEITEALERDVGSVNVSWLVVNSGINTENPLYRASRNSEDKLKFQDLLELMTDIRATGFSNDLPVKWQ